MWKLWKPWHSVEASVYGQVMTDGVLPTLFSRPEVRVVLDYVCINAGKGKLFVRTLRHSLNDQLSIAKWRLGLDLQGTTRNYYRLVAFTFFC